MEGEPLEKVASLEVSTVSGDEKVSLQSLWTGQRAEFDKAGIRLVGIGLERFGLEEFQAGDYWKGELYIDEGQKAYKALQLKRNSIWNGLGLFGKGVSAAFDKAKADGVTGNLKGDGLQMGATFIAGPGEKELVFYHAQESYADHPDPQFLLEKAKEGLEGQTKKEKKDKKSKKEKKDKKEKKHKKDEKETSSEDESVEK